MRERAWDFKGERMIPSLLLPQRSAPGCLAAALGPLGEERKRWKDCDTVTHLVQTERKADVPDKEMSQEAFLRKIAKLL